jgi:hypothetical protein
MSFSGYNRMVLGAVGAFLGLAAWLAATLEPYDGDLTRVGALPERAYGWTGTKPRFVPEAARYWRKGEPIASAEVLVLGDSFSHQSQLGFGWQNYFIARTGLDLLSYNLHSMPALQVLESPALSRDPPRLIVYEIAELNLPDWPPTYGGDCAPPGQLHRPPIRVRPTDLPTEPFSRVTGRGWAIGPRVDQAMHVIKVRTAALLGQSKVAVLPVLPPARFTSRDQALLVYSYEVPGDDWAGLDLGRIACGLRNIRNAAERLLGVPLVFLPVPSKLSVYAGQVPGAPPSYGGFIPQVVERGGLQVPDLGGRLRQAVEAGEGDVYLPNNSHWSDLGHRIAADALYDHLLSLGLIAPAADAGSPAGRTAAP